MLVKLLEALGLVQNQEHTPERFSWLKIQYSLPTEEGGLAKYQAAVEKEQVTISFRDGLTILRVIASPEGGSPGTGHILEVTLTHDRFDSLTNTVWRVVGGHPQKSVIWAEIILAEKPCL